MNWLLIFGNVVAFVAQRNVWPGGEAPRVLQDVAEAAEATESSPIVTVNLWFDGPVMDEPFIEIGKKVVSKALDNRFACWVALALGGDEAGELRAGARVDFIRLETRSPYSECAQTHAPPSGWGHSGSESGGLCPCIGVGARRPVLDPKCPSPDTQARAASRSPTTRHPPFSCDTVQSGEAAVHWISFVPCDEVRFSIHPSI